METFDSLPSRPLRRSEVRRLRERDAVDGFIELEPPAIHLNGGLCEAVALCGHTVIGLSFGDEAWNQRVLAHDADKQRHLREALDQLEGNSAGE